MHGLPLICTAKCIARPTPLPKTTSSTGTIAMDAMDILGALLRKKAGSSGSGGAVLKEILGGNRSAPPSGSATSRQHPGARQPRTIDEAAASLEDLLGVSTSHHQSRRPAESRSVPMPAPTPQRPAEPSWTPRQTEAMNAQAKILARAMVCAAKSDGQITRDEQDAILKQLDHVGDEEIAFLKQAFNEPVSVRDFAWSVPLGMEEQVYSVSLISIDLDEQKEANYLAELAHGLRLSPKTCNAIHQKFGAPIIFQA